ncbi:MAG: stage III sporulation protein AA [Clostridiales bacterium]|nr:stage III sporulation protein AA [Clostridiales bacterium]
MNRRVFPDEILDFMPPNIGGIIKSVQENLLNKMEEIRLRLGKPLMVCGDSWDYYVDHYGQFVEDPNFAYIITKTDIKRATEIIQSFSVYSVNEELKNGYITIPGGHRIGVSGKVVFKDDDIRTIKDISFINYRVARTIPGAADKVMKYLLDESGCMYNTIIISPPQCGKTTLLRDIVRQLSNGIVALKIRGKKVGLVDERSELAACFMGEPKNDVGVRTDVLDACPKAKGIIIMIRSMSPEIIATDEIGRPEDADALLDAANAGVKIIATMHGRDVEDLYKKIELRKIHHNLFERVIILGRSQGVGTVEGIYDDKKNELFLNGVDGN